MVDIDSIFELFGFESNDDKEYKKSEKELALFKQSPIFKVGMFKKMIWNGTNFKDQIVKFLKKSDSSLEVEGGDIRNAGEYMMHTRSYFWIQECDLKGKDWKEGLKHHADDELIVCFKLIVKYFEEIEEYERCAFLKKIQTYVEKQHILKSIRKT